LLLITKQLNKKSVFAITNVSGEIKFSQVLPKLVTGIRNNMKNRLMSLYDKIMLRKRPFRVYLSPGISVTQGVAVGLSYLRASPYGVTRFVRLFRSP